ncbi:MAG TPA: type I-U CRISPR-associated protein Csb2 [Phycisphaerae bacterium]|nr:type I-U CRISPR-associated protein Csb2 [Phycisphaerae bacterium]
MSRQLRLTITFLDARFHGRRDGGEPEWPPSPLRLYQAIVAAAAAPTGRVDHLADALRWFEHLPEPDIIAPSCRAGDPYRLSVPNNAMDLVVKAWSKGNYDGSGDANPATHRTMKTVRPMHLIDGDQVHYVWSLPQSMSEEDLRHAEAIRAAVRSVIALGWGVDLVVAHGEIEESPSATDRPGELGERWIAAPSGVPLRAPVSGTLDALIRRYKEFRGRITDAGFIPVPPLTAFSIVRYRRSNDPSPRSYAAFALRSLDDASKWRAVRQEKAAHVAAMLRHVAWEEAKRDEGNWRTRRWAEEFVAGHGPRDKKESFARFSYLPLPNAGHRHADGMIRRVLVAETVGSDGRCAQWANVRLNGKELIEEHAKEGCAVLAPLSPSDSVLRNFVESSAAWHTVTPVILPGYDDGKPARRDRLLRQCLESAGIPSCAVASMESRPGSFDPASISTMQYCRPKHLQRLPACHVRLVFRQPIAGPIAIGAGRHCGFGLLRAAD